jgi:hypothetical protein
MNISDQKTNVAMLVMLNMCRGRELVVMATEDVASGPLAQVLRISYVNSMEDTATRYGKEC